MSKSRLLAGVALAALCLPVASLTPGMPLGVASAQAQSANVSFQLFFDNLEPHGVWVRHARYNYVFCPTGIDTSWRPYSNGRWLYMRDRGWYFASEEPFAWATYHYGRWFADARLGWCWVPGTKWAPAWVSWRRSDNIVGWAPLPPEDDGYAVSFEVSRRDLPQAYWVYVPTERFIEPDLSISIVFGNQQPEYYTQTEFLGPVVVEGDVVVNNVIDVTYIEQTINQEVVVYEAEEASDPAAAQTASAEGEAITIFAQDVAEPEAEAAPPEVVEETEAATVIETEGGTAGATAEIAAEDPAAAPADTTGTKVEAGAEAGAATEADAPTQAETGADADAAATSETEAAPAEGAASTETDTEATTEEAADPAATTEEAAPAEGEATTDEAACDPDEMVDGVCPVAGEEDPAAEESTTDSEATTEAEATTDSDAAVEADAEAAPAEEAPAVEEETSSEEATPVEEAAPAEVEATTEEAPAAETEATAEEAPAEETAEEPSEAAPATELPCPPETMVDGVCPVPAQ
ncbi:MAG TPA: DUF6600 domain-containing protein [Devosia sp.]|uniref:DUF6600 domain-containing protein n=1 Tax=Devosia sp. TaxID=1871048 RepID=UPI002F932DFC